MTATHIVSSASAIPDHWQDFPTLKQGEDDYACGLYCLLTATRHLRGKQVYARDALGELAPSDADRIRGGLFAGGLRPRQLGRLSDKLGLSRGAPLRSTADLERSFGPPREVSTSVGLLLIRRWFTDPSGRAKPFPDLHFVLVLECLPGTREVVLADPHPWSPPVVVVRYAQLRAWIREAKKARPTPRDWSFELRSA